MNPERAAKLGALSELKSRARHMAMLIDADIRAAKSALALSSVTEIEKLDIEEAAESLKRASVNKADYLKLQGLIRDLREELGE